MMNAHLALLRATFRRLFASPISGLLNILVIGIALSLPSGMYVLLQNAQTLVAQLSGTPQISLFLSLNTTADEIGALRKKLHKNQSIANILFVSRTDALEQLKTETGLEDVIAGLESNPLPDAFVITPRPTDAKTLDKLRNEFQQLPGVEIAQLDSAWAYKLEALLEFARMAVVILASLLSLALVAVIFNTIRLQILTQRDEIQVARLIGATNGFIRRPFLYFGALQGLLGGLVAWLVISISLLLLQQPLAALSTLYATSIQLHNLSPGDSLTLLLFSVYLGWLGAWLSVARHLSQEDAR